jgi:hypothetical protein
MSNVMCDTPLDPVLQENSAFLSRHWGRCGTLSHMAVRWRKLHTTLFKKGTNRGACHRIGPLPAPLASLDVVQS